MLKEIEGLTCITIALLPALFGAGQGDTSAMDVVQSASGFEGSGLANLSAFGVVCWLVVVRQPAASKQFMHDLKEARLDFRAELKETRETDEKRYTAILESQTKSYDKLAVAIERLADKIEVAN